MMRSNDLPVTGTYSRNGHVRLSLAVGAILPAIVAAQGPIDSLRVLSPAPAVRGRFLCSVDSVSASLGDPKVTCKAGGDTSFVIRRDSISSITRPGSAVAVPDSVSLFDYWNRVARADWVRRLGGPPTDIGESSASTPYFEAVWDRPNGVRDIVSLRRSASGRVSSSWGSYDCRPTAPVKAIACR